ncbi:hypothetical protein TIFTF001_015149 [Ficus carica]|uniref:Uncharacterized protein n=1 Tax=Ficus carica TaxID=3494 RepID=A0AA88D7M2_FICCA|nr:hypothetical protein TIFTF001_015149 [Ficus carica]
MGCYLSQHRTKIVMNGRISFILISQFPKETMLRKHQISGFKSLGERENSFTLGTTPLAEPRPTNPVEPAPLSLETIQKQRTSSGFLQKRKPKQPFQQT